MVKHFAVREICVQKLLCCTKFHDPRVWWPGFGRSYLPSYLAILARVSPLWNLRRYEVSVCSKLARCRLLTIRIYSRKYPKYSPLSLLITRYHVLRGRTETFASLLGLSSYVWESTRLGSMSCFVLYIYICSNSSGIRTRIFRSTVCDPIHRVVDRSFRRSNDNRHLFPGQFYISSLLRFPNFSPR